MPNAFQEEVDKVDMLGVASLAEELVYRLPGCADVMVRKTLASVFRDFCKRGCAIRTTRRIDVHPLGDAVVNHVVAGCHVDAVVDIVEDGRVMDRRRWCVVQGNIVRIHRFHHPNVCVHPSVYDAVALEVPDIGSEEAPRWFIEKFGDAISTGALARLFAMSGRPWSDPNQAAALAREYENAVSESRSRYYAGGDGASGNINFFKKGLVL